MRFLKMLALAAIAASVALAIVGACSASATALCTQAPETKGTDLVCKKGTVFEEVTVLGTSEGNVVVTSKENAKDKVECVSAFEDLFVVFGEKMIGSLNPLTFGGCTTTIKGCSVTSAVANTPFETEAVYTQTVSPEGKVVLLMPQTTIKFLCGTLPITCPYGGNPGETVSGDLYNGEQKLRLVNAEVKLEGVVLSCPKAVTLTATYNLKQNGGKVGGKAVGAGPVYIAKE